MIYAINMQVSNRTLLSIKVIMEILERKRWSDIMKYVLYILPPCLLIISFLLFSIVWTSSNPGVDEDA